VSKVINNVYAIKQGLEKVQNIFIYAEQIIFSYGHCICIIRVGRVRRKADSK